MRIHRRRRVPGRKRPNEWLMSFGATVGGPQSFFHDSLIVHWAIYPIGAWDTSNQTYPGDTVTQPQDITLVRSLSNWSFFCEAPNGTTTGSGSFRCSLIYGLMKVTAPPDPTLWDGQTFDSADQVPGPWTNASDDWLYRSVSLWDSTAPIPNVMAGLGDFKSTESRAMRKLSFGEGIIQVLEFQMAGASFTDFRKISWQYESRMYTKG